LVAAPVQGLKARKYFRRIPTLTLSLGEREQPLVDALKSGSHQTRFSRSFAKKLGAFLPLPDGEGRGEGKQNVTIPSLRTHPDQNQKHELL
jgi:hypothetical protein